MNIHALIETSHILGRDHGFWEKEKDLREEMLYIFSNLGDIAKAFKKGRRADWNSYEKDLLSLESYPDVQNINLEKRAIYKECIKDTFEDEIANVILRITDLIGGKKIDIISAHPWIEPFENSELNHFFVNVRPREEFNKNVAHWLNEALSMCLFSSDKDEDYGLSHILFHLGSLIEFYNIDIERHLAKKIEYNRLRPSLYKS
nr:hypothetical protein [uncultured archaeon]